MIESAIEKNQRGHCIFATTLTARRNTLRAKLPTHQLASTEFRRVAAKIGESRAGTRRRGTAGWNWLQITSANTPNRTGVLNPVLELVRRPLIDGPMQASLHVRNALAGTRLEIDSSLVRSISTMEMVGPCWAVLVADRHGRPIQEGDGFRKEPGGVAARYEFARAIGIHDVSLCNRTVMCA